MEKIKVGDIFQGPKYSHIIDKVIGDDVWIRPCGNPLVLPSKIPSSILPKLEMINITARERKMKIWKDMK